MAVIKEYYVFFPITTRETGEFMCLLFQEEDPARAASTRQWVPPSPPSSQYIALGQAELIQTLLSQNVHDPVCIKGGGILELGRK